MVYYYCEWCNKNVNIRAGQYAICKDCGSQLYNTSITNEERNRRKKERTTYCEKCDQMVLSIPTHVMLREYQRRSSSNLQRMRSNSPSFIFKKKKQEHKEKVEEVQHTVEYYLNYLRTTTFQSICPKCYSGVILYQKPPSRMRKKGGLMLMKCAKCGQEINIEHSFCANCGHPSDFVRVSSEARTRNIPKEVVGAVWMRDGGKCVRCESTENLQLDHIIPFSKGGANTVENLQLLCQRCNLEKSDKIGE